MDRRPTIKDVARASGVSPTTVSFVLNATPRQTIPTATQDRVRDAARTLGYTPHRIARALREGSSRVVVLNSGSWRGGHSLDSFIAGLDDELRQSGHTLLVRHTRDSDESMAELVDAIEPRAVIDLAKVDLSPVEMQAGGWVDGLGPATTAQLRHLVETGHTAIALALPPPEGQGALVELRREHAVQVSEQLGLPPIVLVGLGASRGSASAALAGLVAQHPEITAIAAYDDEVALLALSALAELGLAVPARLAVIGFDDDHYGSIWSPTLTSVHIDAEAYGRRAARACLGVDLGEWSSEPSSVVRRESA